MLKDISHYIADIAYNSLKVRATVLDISLEVADSITLTIRDDVSADKDALIEASHRTPTEDALSGLGLPYLRMAVDKYNGTLDIDSDDSGTTVRAEFSTDIEIGNLGDAIVTLLTEDRIVTLTLTIIGKGNSSTIAVSEKLKELGGATPSALKLVRELVNLNQKSILGGTTV